MEIRTFKPLFVIIGLLVLTSLTLAMTVDSTLTDESGISLDLPDLVGEWEGAEIRFCLNPEHQEAYTMDELEDPNVCPECGSEMSSMTLTEKSLLPSDTEIVKKRYRDRAGRIIFVTIVMSGKERASIHRPERCLVGQGSEIVGQNTITVPMADRDNLDVKVLDMLRKVRLPSGEQANYGRYYAYWFVGKDRETPSHYARMFWMAADRIFVNKAHRWSYIAVSGSRDLESDEYLDEIKSFVAGMYPDIIVDPALKPHPNGG